MAGEGTTAGSADGVGAAVWLGVVRDGSTIGVPLSEPLHALAARQVSRTIGTQRLRTPQRVQICRVVCESPVDNTVGPRGEVGRPTPAARRRCSEVQAWPLRRSPATTHRSSPSRGKPNPVTTRQWPPSGPPTDHRVGPADVGPWLPGPPAIDPAPARQLVRNCRTCRLGSGYGPVDVGEAGGRA